MPDISTYTPGVYVKEVETGTRPIQAVGTSTAGFIGVAPWKTARVGEVYYLTNWNQFKDQYFPPPEETVKPDREKEEAAEIKKDKAIAELNTIIAAETDPGIKARLQEFLQAIQEVAAPKAAALYDLNAKMEAEKDPVKKVILQAVLQVEQAKARQETAQKDLQIKKGKAVQAVAQIEQEISALRTQGAENSPEKQKGLQARQAELEKAKTTIADIDKEEAVQKKNEEEELKNHPDSPWTFLAHAVQGFFLNGGSACYVINLGEDVNGEEIVSFKDGLDQLNRIDEIAILAAPGYQDDQTYTNILDICDTLADRVAILDGPDTIHNEHLRLLGGAEIQDWKGWKMPDKSERGMATLYTPWLWVANPNSKTNKKVRAVLVPPSGHIAGIWARSDANRGVHKAPANERVSGALDLQYPISAAEQSNLNKNGVNCIRYFTGEGNLVWGARTLTRDPLWTYLNVRRLFNQIEESILKSTRWIVFEPNDRPLWQAIKRDVTAFLMTYWRSGALMGKTPEEAFFVKCDEENNPFEEIILGRVHIDIGIAPVRPAEFVIFQIAQFEAGSEVKVSGA